ncbi:MAG TPA: clan AA aspartic protease [Planctomycetaceae bacterium]|nr:clan AA aspartic protease [Planctomycetaceae bacterium]
MGLIRTQLELLNGDDLALTRRGKLPVEEIRKMKVTALVDCGAMMLAINENICQQLGLMKVEERLAELADGSIRTYDVVGPIEVRIPHRRCSVDAMVLPGDAEVLLGAIPMEDMDLVIEPKSQTVQVNPSMPYISKKPMK